MSVTVDNLTCAACGCICEDVSVRIVDGVITAVAGACAVCENQLLGQTAGDSSSLPIAEAVDILRGARSPLIYGLRGSTVETQRAAVALAETLRATLDLAISAHHRAALRALPAVGMATCTLGEVKQRADVVVFWDADPTDTHPQLLERFIEPAGQFVRGSRYIVSVGALPPKYHCDEHFHVAPADNLPTLATLRALAAAHGLPNTNAETERLRQLATRLRDAQYSVIFVGHGVEQVVQLDALFRLVRQLNTRSRCSVMSLGGTQCENVLAWQTGYPCCVNFALGHPRYDPVMYCASTVLERGQVDAVLLIGGAGVAYLSAKARERLADLPIILVDYPARSELSGAKVHAVAGQPGVHCGGTVFRMDGVPFRLRPVFDSQLPSAASVLSAIQQGVSASCV